MFAEELRDGALGLAGVAGGRGGGGICVGACGDGVAAAPAAPGEAEGQREEEVLGREGVEWRAWGFGEWRREE